MVITRSVFLLLRLKNWIWKKLGWTSLPPLREFVYMEEDTVISLLASTTGGITEQQTTGQKKRISSSITGNLGVSQAGVKSSIGASKEESSEVVRQYVIESNFKELYDMREDKLVISDNTELDYDNPSVITNGSEKEDDPSFSEAKTEELERGNLIEVDVELGSAEVFDYYRVIQAFDNIFETISSKSDLREQLDAQDLSSEEIEMVIELMEILMADLIPIVGTAKNYGVAENSEVIVDKTWADQNGIGYEELDVVGFVDEDNLWLDPTRVLFDDAEFTVYARVDKPLVQGEWMPMKLLDVVDKVFPGIGDDIKNLPDAFSDVETDGQRSLNTSGSQLPIQSSLRDDLSAYIEEIEAELNLEIDDEDKEAIVEEVGETIDRTGEVDDRIGAFQEVEEKLRNKDYNIQVDEDLSVELASRVWRKDEVDLGESDEAEGDGYYLETSFVAIYW